MVEVPPICRVPKLVSAPEPESTVVALNVPTFKFVYVPVTDIFGMVTLLIVLPAPVNVWTTPPAVKVPLLARLPPKLTGQFPELFQTPPELIVTLPVKVFAPPLALMPRVPETLVAPPTVMAYEASWRVPPEATVTVAAAAPAARVTVWPLQTGTMSPAPGYIPLAAAVPPHEAVDHVVLVPQLPVARE